MSSVFSKEQVADVAREMKVADLQNATIGDVLLVASRLEEQTGIPFIRMDQGSPGLPANKVGIEAEKRALDAGLGAQYPAAAGVPELKEAASRFVKAFIDIDISPRACVPTTGSVAASFGAFIACTQRIPGKNKVLFIDPGFPIQKSQLRILGIGWEYFDIHDFRELATRYDVVVVEDQAYFCMDFRHKYGRPYQPPFVPTVARYTDNYILMLSASKIFSYAGQRIALACISDKLFDKQYPALAKRYEDSGVFRPHVHRFHPVYDYIGMYSHHPVRHGGDAGTFGIGRNQLRGRRARVRTPCQPDEEDIHR